jgi:hypothetical protein
MKTFARDDGRTLRVVDGFREYVLAAGKRSVHPQPDWRDEDYSAAAKRWMKRSQRLLADLAAGAVTSRVPGPWKLEPARDWTAFFSASTRSGEWWVSTSDTRCSLS